MKKLYCQFCENYLTCKVNCHALKLKPRFNLPIFNCYVKDEDENAYSQFLEMATSKCRLLNDSDENFKLGRKTVVLCTSGNPPRSVFQGWKIIEADYGTIGYTFVDLWLVQELVSYGQSLKLENPIRLKKDGGKVFVLDDGENRFGY